MLWLSSLLTCVDKKNSTTFPPKQYSTATLFIPRENKRSYDFYFYFLIKNYSHVKFSLVRINLRNNLVEHTIIKFL